MKKFIISFILLSIFFGTPLMASPIEVKVKKFVDGDTFEIESENFIKIPGLGLAIRVNGMDTPEKGGRAKCKSEADLSKQASEATKSILSNAKKIEIDNYHWDKFGGRIVADVFADGVLLSKQIIDEHLAKPYFGKKKESWCSI